MVHSWHKEAQIKWDESAKNWAANSKEMWDGGSRKTIIPFFVEHIPLGKVVDLGCGDGYGSLKLARAGFQVIGLDLSQKMIPEYDLNMAEEFLEQYVAAIRIFIANGDAVDWLENTDGEETLVIMPRLITEVLQEKLFSQKRI